MTAQEILDNAIKAQANAKENTVNADTQHDDTTLVEVSELQSLLTSASPIETPEQALETAQQLQSIRPQKDNISKACKELESRLKSYVAANRAQLLQNGAKSYTFPGTNVQVVLSETTTAELDHPELLTSEFEGAFCLANPANANAFTHKLDHTKLQNDEATNALKLQLGMRTVVTEKWSLTFSKAKKTK